MSINENKTRSWEWSSDGSKLNLKNTEELGFIIIYSIFILPFLYILLIIEWRWSTANLIFTGTFLFVFGFLLLIMRTTTFNKEISLEDVEKLVDKGILFEKKIAIKLKNGKYRIVKFNRKKDKREFMDQFASKRIELVQRKSTWSLPITY